MAASEVFKLFGTIGANTKPVEDSLDKVTGKAKKAQKELTFDQKVDRSIIRAGNSVLKLGAALGGVIAAAGAFVIKGGISRALNIEDAQAKLRGLGHDAESVTDIMDSALASVKGTAYGLDAAATIAAGAVAAGIKPGQELTKYLKMTADTATIAGANLEEIGPILNRVQTSQTAYTEDLNMLADRGLPVFQWLQEEYGVTAQELRKMVSNGEVDAQTYFKVIQENIGGAALESGATTRGAFANMRAAFSRLGAALVADALPKAREFFLSVIEWVDANQEAIVGFVKTVVGAITTAVKFIGDHQTAFKNIAVIIASLLIPAIMRYIQLQTIAGVKALIAGAKMAKGWLLAMGPIGLVVAAVVAAVALIIMNWEWISEKASEIWGAITKFFTGLWKDVQKAWNDTWTNIRKFFTGLWNGIKNTVQAIWNTIKEFFIGVWKTMVAAAQLIWQAFLDFLTVVIGIPLAIINTLLIQPLIVLWGWFWEGLKATAEFVWGAITAAIEFAVNLVKNIITAALDFIKPYWDVVWHGIRTTFESVWSAIKSFFTPIIKWFSNIIDVTFHGVKNVIETVLNTIRDIFTTVWNAIKSVVTTALNAIKSAISTALNAIKNTFSSIWNAIKSTVSSAVNSIRSTVSSVFNSVKSTVTSLWNGIKSAIEKPINKARDIVKAAIDKIKGFFGFKITWPKIPMPKFSINPSGWKIGDLLKGSIPKLGIDFHAAGGIMRGPTIFDIRNGRAQVGGEAGDEAILPLNREVLGDIGAGIADTMKTDDQSAILEALLAEIRQLREDQKDLKVIMDSGELVASIRKKIDQALENDANLRRRGVTT